MAHRTVLVDDEPLALRRLERLLEPYGETVEVVGTAQGGADAVALINKLKPDLIFLDIQMPELSGFDVIERLEYTPLIVFSTAFDRYALEAFEVNSVDYLLKPVDPARLEKTVEKLLRLSDGGAEDLRQKIETALATLQKPKSHRIPVRVGDKIRLIPVADVVYFLASDKYVEVHTIREMHLITKSLSRLESELSPDDFVRVHRSALVNINFIDEIAKGFGGAYEVRMKDGKKTRLPVSRRFKSRLDLK